jgi:PKHD-type hydroxylase
MDNAGKLYFAPKQRGAIIFFDSRTPHRVRKIKSGMRKSLVGWVVGPR